MKLAGPSEELDYPLHRIYVTPHPTFKDCIIVKHNRNLTAARKTYSVLFKAFDLALDIYFHDPNDLFNYLDNARQYVSQKETAQITFNDICLAHQTLRKVSKKCAHCI